MVPVVPGSRSTLPGEQRSIARAQKPKSMELGGYEVLFALSSVLYVQ
jgi:hypothetical protein